MENAECGLCSKDFDPIVRVPYITSCGHSFCKKCLTENFTKNHKVFCKKCKLTIDEKAMVTCVNNLEFFVLGDGKEPGVEPVNGVGPRPRETTPSFIDEMQVAVDEKTGDIHRRLERSRSRVEVLHMLDKKLQTWRRYFHKLENTVRDMSTSNVFDNNLHASIDLLREMKDLVPSINQLNECDRLPDEMRLDCPNIVDYFTWESVENIRHSNESHFAWFTDGVNSRYGRLGAGENHLYIACLDDVEVPKGAHVYRYSQLFDGLDLIDPLVYIDLEELVPVSVKPKKSNKSKEEPPSTQPGKIDRIQIRLMRPSFSVKQFLLLCSGERGYSLKGSVAHPNENCLEKICCMYNGKPHKDDIIDGIENETPIRTHIENGAVVCNRKDGCSTEFTIYKTFDTQMTLGSSSSTIGVVEGGISAVNSIKHKANVVDCGLTINFKGLLKPQHF